MSGVLTVPKARPTKPFAGKVRIWIDIDAADPNGDAACWLYPAEIKSFLQDRVKANAEKAVIISDAGGFVHESWIKDFRIGVSVHEGKEPFWKSLLRRMLGW